MAVVNLNPGGVFNVAANQIHGNAHVYRTGQGYPDPGNVGWVPNGAAAQIRPLPVGHTTTFAINDQAGMIANGCPSNVQVLYDNGAAMQTADVHEGEAIRVLAFESAKSQSAKSRKSRSKVQVVDDANDPAAEAMNKLTAQWYNAVVNGCHLDPDTFQLIQGATPLGSTSETLWNILDVVPPLSVSNYYNPSQLNVFSTDYGGVINNLKPQNADRFQNDMGDYYAQWVAYLKTGPTVPEGGILALFKNWSQLNLSPGLAQQCYTDYQQVSQGVVPVAVQMWLNAGGGAGGKRKAYNATIAQLQSAIAAAPSASFQMDSSSESSDVSHSWAKVEAGGILDFFEAGGDSSYDNLTIKMASSGMIISAKFDHLVTFAAGPLSQPSTDPILSGYQPWYSSAALNLAYQNNNNVVWNNAPPTWDNSFGADGNMLRTTSALVIVDGVTLTMTSSQSYSSDEQTKVRAAIEAGFWPFFEISSSGGWDHDVSFASDGSMTITSNSPTGNPTILGAIVTPISGVMML